MSVNNVNERVHVPGFRNMDAEPEEIFPAIQGYEKEPLVSLEEAIKPLTPYVQEVERMAQMVKDLCDAPEGNLTRDESASILLYSMEWDPSNQSFCYILNTTLQKTDRKILKPWFPYLRLIMSALDKLPSESNRFTVYRGLKMNVTDQLRKGSKTVWWAFSSCTMSLDVLNNERFLGNSGSRTLFVIDCHSGKKIRNHTLYPDEEEVLFFPACQFEVMGCINEVNDLIVVQLKEIEPKYAMINSVKSSKTTSPNVALPVSTPTQQYMLTAPTPTEQRISPTLTEQRISPTPTEQRISPTPTQQDMSPEPTEQPISPTFVSTSIVSISIDRKLKSSLPVQRSFAASCRPVLPPIQPSHNLERHSIMLPTTTASQIVKLPIKPTQQPITQPAARTQVEARTTRQSTAKSSYDNNKPAEQRNPFHIDPDSNELDLRDHLIGEDGAKNIAENLKSNQTLTTLSLWYNKINDRAVQYLADSLKSNTTLTTLHLSYNEISHQGAVYIADCLQCNNTLTTLYLSYNKIGDQGAQSLANALRNNTSLTTLNLFSNEIGSQGVKDLADALRENKKLTTLNLADNQIDDIGVQHIAHALRFNTTLKTLNLNNNQIGNTGAQALAKTLKNYKTLANLYIYNKGFNSETKKLFEELKKNNSGLKIFL